ncbi:MAG: hypothetical protein Q8L68_03675, partial [Methylococcales bacterium]|nr:hypothetical protein [Methylococcales bacterium]
TLPIWSFGFTEHISEFANGAKTFQIKLPPDALNNQSQVKLMLSSSLLGSLPAAMEYLLDYPYGCVEQTTSHFVPVVIARLNTGLFSEAIKNKDLDAMVVKGVDHLAELQNSSGAWGWWYDEENKPFVSAYVLEYLLKARSTGIKIDNTVITRAQQYFTDSWGEDENNKPASIAKYYALGLLGTKAKFKFNFDLTQLTPDKLALAVMANYMAGNTDPATNGLSILESKADRRGGRASWASGDYDLFGSVDASTALAMRAIIFAHGNSDLVREGARYLLENRRQSYWSNTFATAQIIQAVVDLHQIDKQASANSSYQVLLNGAELTNGRIADNTKSVEILISTSSLNLGLGTLEVKPAEGAVLYSNFIVKEFRTDPNAPAMDNGLKVKREYVSSRGDGKFIAVGDRVTVVTTVTGLKEGDRYVVVDDELPSGLIPINTNLKNNQVSNDEQRAFYFDVGYKLNGASMSTYYVYAGDTVFKYDARAVSSGVFQVPPVSASLMYAPTTLGRSGAQSLEIFTLDK